MKSLFVFLIPLLALCASVHAQDVAGARPKEKKEITYSEIRQLIDDGALIGATVSGDGWWVTVKTNDGATFYAPVTPQTPIADRLIDAGVPTKITHIKNDNSSVRPLWRDVLFNLSPLLIFLVFLVFILFLTRGFNKNIWKKNDDHLSKAEQINNDYLARAEKLQNEFFDRLEKVLTERKNPNG